MKMRNEDMEESTWDAMFAREKYALQELKKYSG